MSNIDTARRELVAAERRLFIAIKNACPGAHLLKQHRDRKPPWCESCGRDDRGRQHASAFDLDRAKGDAS